MSVVEVMNEDINLLPSKFSELSESILEVLAAIKSDNDMKRVIASERFCVGEIALISSLCIVGACSYLNHGEFEPSTIKKVGGMTLLSVMKKAFLELDLDNVGKSFAQFLRSHGLVPDLLKQEKYAAEAGEKPNGFPVVIYDYSDTEVWQLASYKMTYSYASSVFSNNQILAYSVEEFYDLSLNKIYKGLLHILKEAEERNILDWKTIVFS